MNLTTHFTLEEATVSQEAARRGIDNTPDEAMIRELIKTARFMEDVRAALGGKPIIVSSWYRCDELERAIVGLSPTQRSTGHHPLGAAVDFICPGFGSPREVGERLTSLVNPLGIGQLIYEYQRWIHISRLPVPRPEINRVLTIDQHGTRSGIFA